MGKRPAGISALAFLYVFFLTISLISKFSHSTYSWLIIVLFLIVAVTGIALYKGKKWAWWVIGALTMFTFIRNVYFLYLAFSYAESIPDIGVVYLEYGGKFIFQSIILLFLFSKPVAQFLDFKNSDTFQRLLFLLAIGFTSVLFLLFFDRFF